jgi:putative membrane protein
MKSILMTTAFAAAVALAACGQPAQQAATPASETAADAMTPAAAVIDPAAKTLDFATNVAKSDATEIAMSKAAVAKTTNADVKKFANMLITAHTKTSKELKDWAAKTTVALPPESERSGQGKIDEIVNADAKDQKDFNMKYLNNVVDAHQDTISKFQDYADNGAEANLKAWAVSTLPALREHLTAAKALREKLSSAG